MTTLDDRLRALRDEWAVPDGAYDDRSIDDFLHAAAAIGAELGEAKGRAEAYEEAARVVWEQDVPSRDEYPVDALTLRNGIYDAIRARAAAKAGKP